MIKMNKVLGFMSFLFVAALFISMTMKAKVASEP
jgi:hypothetical protein